MPISRDYIWHRCALIFCFLWSKSTGQNVQKTGLILQLMKNSTKCNLLYRMLVTFANITFFTAQYVYFSKQSMLYIGIFRATSWSHTKWTFSKYFFKCRQAAAIVLSDQTYNQILKLLNYCEKIPHHLLQWSQVDLGWFRSWMLGNKSSQQQQLPCS